MFFTESNSCRLGESIFDKKIAFLAKVFLAEWNPRRTRRVNVVRLLSYMALVKHDARANWNKFVQAEGLFLSPGKRHISAQPEGRIGPKSRVGAPPGFLRLCGRRACVDPPETAHLQERYFCGAAIQYTSKQLLILLLNCPPLIFSFLI